jgi:hypothetical protein
MPAASKLALVPFPIGVEQAASLKKCKVTVSAEEVPISLGVVEALEGELGSELVTVGLEGGSPSCA